MTDRDPTATAASVSRGMRALLARRDADLDAGAAPVGWKIGFNTPAIQAHFGLTDAVVGYMLDTGVRPDGASVSLAGWAVPAVEVEVAIRVGADGRRRWNWWTWTSRSRTSSPSWPATSAIAA
jgi:2-keto-4-pentenoate hydratase